MLRFRLPSLSHPRTLSRNVDGSTAIEFGLLALPFFSLILATIQLIYLLLVQQMIETATEAVGRQILTGIVQQQAMTKQQFTTLACSLLPPALDCTKLIIDVQVAAIFDPATGTTAFVTLLQGGNPWLRARERQVTKLEANLKPLAKPDLTSIGNPSATTVLTYNPGVAGQIVVLRLLYALPVVKIPGLNLQSAASSYGFAFPMATSVFKNETYS